MAEQELYRAPLAVDLRPLSALLWQQRIAHRIAEEGGEQVLRLADAAKRGRAEELLQRWQRGELRVVLQPRPRPPAGRGFAAAIAAAPVTVALIALAVVGFLVIYLGAPLAWVSAFTYAPFTVENGNVIFAGRGAELWRLVTPVFIHFGWLHIAFNALWCWELGRRIEVALGSTNLFGLFLVIAVLSNSAQWQFSPGVLFGGLSGVVYGLLGFSWVAGTLHPQWRSLVPARPIMLLMIGWLLFCIFGLVNVLGFAVANAAHVGGLLSGAVLGAAFAVAHRARR